jgi:hypothetical protein
MIKKSSHEQLLNLKYKALTKIRLDHFLFIGICNNVFVNKNKIILLTFIPIHV